MARTSKKRSRETFAEVLINETEGLVYNTGIYARLSSSNHNEKDESIETQIVISKEYIKQHPELKLYDSYADLGKSGTNFDRSEFERLLQDIRMYKVNCIIVKDFSRFGRDHIETGNYLEKIFPFLGVRFISVNDRYDSLTVDSDNAKLSMNLKNLVNEMYARDISNKITAVKKVEQENGSYTGGIAPYGYLVEKEKDKKVLSPEPEAGAVIVEIFQMYDEGKSMTDIVSDLYERKIHRPTEYRAYGHVFQASGENLKEWCPVSLKEMLINPVYIGNLLQGRAGSKFRKKMKKHGVMDDEWCIRENTHKALVEEEVYYRVAKRFEEQSKKFCKQRGYTHIIPLEEDSFQDVLYCGECGKKMNRASSVRILSSGDAVRNYNYLCKNSGRIDELRCASKHISEYQLLDILKETLRIEFSLHGIKAKDLVEWNKQNVTEAKEKILKEIQESKKELTKKSELLSKKYLEYHAGKISKQQFSTQKKENEEQQLYIEERIKSLESDYEMVGTKLSNKKRFLHSLMKWENGDQLKKGLIQGLIKRIEIYPDKRLEIHFHFTAHELLSREGGRL